MLAHWESCSQLSEDLLFCQWLSLCELPSVTLTFLKGTSESTCQNHHLLEYRASWNSGLKINSFTRECSYKNGKSIVTNLSVAGKWFLCPPTVTPNLLYAYSLKWKSWQALWKCWEVIQHSSCNMLRQCLSDNTHEKVGMNKESSSPPKSSKFILPEGRATHRNSWLS